MEQVFPAYAMLDVSAKRMRYKSLPVARSVQKSTADRATDSLYVSFTVSSSFVRVSNGNSPSVHLRHARCIVRRPDLTETSHERLQKLDGVP